MIVLSGIVGNGRYNIAMASQTSEASEESQQASTELAPAGGRVSSRHSCQLPMTRVKNIIKSDPEISLTSTEATLIIAKATELFIGHLARQGHIYTVKGKRKTIQKRDIDACIPSRDELAFLEGTLD